MISAVEAKNSNYVCATLSAAILILRLVATRLRDRRFDFASWFVVASLLLCLPRVLVVYYYLKYGTSNGILNKLAAGKHVSAYAYEHVKEGSILAVVGRLLITTFYWLQICILLIFYSKLCREFHWRVTINACWALIATTWVAVVLASCLECQPFHKYWQVHPYPGTCERAYVQLLVQSICNIVLDLCLLGISIPLIGLSLRDHHWSHRFKIYALLTLGTFCIVVTSLKVVYVITSESNQPTRSFWASVQMLVSCFVANAPTIYGSLNLARKRKSESRSRRASRPEGFGSSSYNSKKFADSQTMTPPAPVAFAEHTNEEKDEVYRPPHRSSVQFLTEASDDD